MRVKPPLICLSQCQLFMPKLLANNIIIRKRQVGGSSPNALKELPISHMPESEPPPEARPSDSLASSPDPTLSGGAGIAEAHARLERLGAEFEEIKRSLAQLRRIAKPDPAMALVRARRVLEYVIRELFRALCAREGWHAAFG